MLIVNCPTCNQPFPPDFQPRVDLAANLLVGPTHTLSLTPVQAEIMLVLVRKPGHITRHAELDAAVYGAALDHPEPHAMTVHLHNLRQRLQGFGLAIESVHGVGYRLVHEDAPGIESRQRGEDE